MTALRKFSTQFVIAASAFALSFAMFSVTVSTPSAPVPVQAASIFA